MQQSHNVGKSCQACFDNARSDRRFKACFSRSHGCIPAPCLLGQALGLLTTVQLPPLSGIIRRTSYKQWSADGDTCSPGYASLHNLEEPSLSLLPLINSKGGQHCSRLAARALCKRSHPLVLVYRAVLQILQLQKIATKL